MVLHFHEPPPAQKIGGLEAAIRSLQSALERRDHTVLVNPEKDAPAPDAVHFHGLWQREFPALAKGRRYVVSPHGMLEPWAFRHKWWKKWPYFHAIEKRWLRHAACILATADMEAERLRARFPTTRVAAIPLGLTGDAGPDYDAARAKCGWANGAVLLYLSRVHEKKGLDLLLAALALVEIPVGTRLVIVGPDEQPEFAARCRRLAAALESRVQVTWNGPVWGDGRWEFFQGADLFCLPTHSENFGLVVLESLQCGTPVLTTDATPWSSLRQPAGYIASPSVESVSAQLTRFFAAPRVDAAARAALAERTRREFHWDALVERYEEIYRGCAAKPRTFDVKS